MSLERNASRLGAVILSDNGRQLHGSKLLLCVVRKIIYRRRVMLILEYISTHGTPEWCAARMSARGSKGPLPAYEQLCTSCTGVARGTHSSWLSISVTAGFVPAVADVPGRTTLHHL